MSEKSEGAGRRRGRPKGAINKADPPGAKRARKYWELRDKGMTANAAAEKVAEKYGVDYTTIFKDAKQHDSRLSAEILREVEAIKAALRERLGEHVSRREVEAALKEARDMIEACADRRLKSLAREIAGAKTEKEVRDCFARYLIDVSLELTHRFVERAKALRAQPVYFYNSGVELENGAALVFERFAEGLKPRLG
ncbi:MAG: hypothetical protein IT512_06810 [Rhodocyclaceae bacterium]|nr:hypothetical protein [Rhodocyclaceae bacterium]